MFLGQVLVRLTDGTMSIASRADIKAANQPITETPVSSVASHSVPESSSTANLDKAKGNTMHSLSFHIFSPTRHASISYSKPV